MAHPSEVLAKSIYVISTTTTDVFATPKSGKFFSITCSIGGVVKVKGGGVYEYVDVSDATNTFQNYIDPATGVAFVSDAAMNAAGDAFYESISSQDTDLTMIAGQTIYGRFDSLKSDGTFTGFAYAG